MAVINMSDIEELLESVEEAQKSKNPKQKEQDMTAPANLADRAGSNISARSSAHS